MKEQFEQTNIEQELSSGIKEKAIELASYHYGEKIIFPSDMIKFKYEKVENGFYHLIMKVKGMDDTKVLYHKATKFTAPTKEKLAKEILTKIILEPIKSVISDFEIKLD